jgi:hypothetical protein
MREDLPDRPRIGNERDESDVATTPRARKRKLLPHPGHEFGLWRREVSWEGSLSHESQPWQVASPSAACPPTACPPVAASRGLPTFPFVMRRDGGPELVIRGEHPWLALRRQGHPWPLPPLAVGAKAEVWLDRHASLRLADAGASAAAARGQRAGRGTQMGKARRRRWRPAVWTYARVPGRPSWPPCVGGARSGRRRCGRLRRASRRAAPARRAAGHSIAAGARGANNRHAVGDERV